MQVIQISISQRDNVELAIVLLSMLAVWRATYMVQEEKGPYEIFSRLQAWFWKDPVRLGGLKDGLRCFKCTSVWLSFIPALYVAHSNVIKLVIVWFAISAGAIFINSISEKLDI